jgi:hypothetical protein
VLNPMIRWEPGTTVTYHGDRRELRGTYRAYRCGCHRHDDERTSVRFQLADNTGHIAVTCVRPRSITPASKEG